MYIDKLFITGLTLSALMTAIWVGFFATIPEKRKCAGWFVAMNLALGLSLVLAHCLTRAGAGAGNVIDLISRAAWQAWHETAVLQWLGVASAQQANAMSEFTGIAPVVPSLANLLQQLDAWLTPHMDPLLALVGLDGFRVGQAVALGAPGVWVEDPSARSLLIALALSAVCLCLRLGLVRLVEGGIARFWLITGFALLGLVAATLDAYFPVDSIVGLGSALVYLVSALMLTFALKTMHMDLVRACGNKLAVVLAMTISVPCLMLVGHAVHIIAIAVHIVDGSNYELMEFALALAIAIAVVNILALLSLVVGVVSKAYLMSLQDHLTGLFNRRYLEKTMAAEHAKAVRSGQPYSVIMVDVDHFKRINDTFGHVSGDLILQKVAKTLQATARQADVVGRLGGEEFCIVLPATELEGAVKAAERFRAAIEAASVQIDNKPVRATASLGVATFSDPYEEWLEILERSDEVLYEAKKGGRNRVAASNVRAPIPIPEAHEMPELAALQAMAQDVPALLALVGVDRHLEKSIAAADKPHLVAPANAFRARSTGASGAVAASLPADNCERRNASMEPDSQEPIHPLSPAAVHARAGLR